MSVDDSSIVLKWPRAKMDLSGSMSKNLLSSNDAP